ncbi:hypothetical protein ILUMI_07826 [Ignelater luminosus]|uniref:RNA-directed DNA polymerase n=1 Tax=Ignelater luminosus TaxID=2038154 RepID=A0A8K0D8M4_IGNLU|nr:hypothetical protein ILUMI_07826 [Ignelater luminosus]
MNIKLPTGRLARWALLIQSFNVKIDYLPGRRNVVADTLSRSPFPDLPPGEKIPICITIPGRSPSEVRSQQLEDPELAKIIHSFEDSDDSDLPKWIERGYLMSNGLLYRYSQNIDSEEAALAVPHQKRDRILHEYLDLDLAAHYGVDRTYRRIAQRYFWIGMKKYIAEYLKNCGDCQRYKASNQKPAGLVQTPEYAQKFEVLSIDLFDPLPERDAGERWIFIIKDTASKWVELFALIRPAAEEY